MNLTIQTHNGKFHCDEVGAISILVNCHKDYQIRIIRSRDPELMVKADILVDVGGIYDDNIRRYDHHQKECKETFTPESKIPLSSIGMVWKHYGKSFLSLFLSHNDYDTDEIHIDNLYNEIYFKLIQEIDAHDNGIQSVEGGTKNFNHYLILSQIISSCNTPNVKDDEAQQTAFYKAMELFNTCFEIKLSEIVRQYFEYITSYDKVKSIYDCMRPEDEYIYIDSDIPLVYRALNNIDPNNRVKFLIFNNDNEYSVKTRSQKENFYKPIVPLIPDISNTDIDSNDIIFIHKARFLGKTKSLDSAIRLVELSLQNITKEKRYNPWLIGGVVGVLAILGWVAIKKN